MWGNNSHYLPSYGVLVSDSCHIRGDKTMKNSGDNVFEGVPVGREEASLFVQFLSDHDFAAHTRKAYTQDVRKFAGLVRSANQEPFVVGRVTTRDVTDFRDHLRRQQGRRSPPSIAALVAVQEVLRLAGGSWSRRRQSCQAGEGTSPPATCPQRIGKEPGAAAAPRIGIAWRHSGDGDLLHHAVRRIARCRCCRAGTSTT